MLKLSSAAFDGAEQQPEPPSHQGGGASPAAGARARPAGAAQRAAAAAVADLLADVEAGRAARLQHCQRILPVQATCLLEAAALEAAGACLAPLVSQAAGQGSEAAAEAPCQLSFGVGFKPRGSDAAPAKKAKAKKPAPVAAPAPAAAERSAAGEQEGEAEATAGAEAAAAEGKVVAAAGEAGAAAQGLPLPVRMEVIKAVAAGFESGMRQRGVAPKVRLLPCRRFRSCFV